MGAQEGIGINKNMRVDKLKFSTELIHNLEIDYTSHNIPFTT